MRLKVGRLVIVWDGAIALPAVMIADADIPTAQEWAPSEGESIPVLSPKAAAGNVSIDAALRGHYALRSAADDMQDTQGGVMGRTQQ